MRIQTAEKKKYLLRLCLKISYSLDMHISYRNAGVRPNIEVYSFPVRFIRLIFFKNFQYLRRFRVGHMFPSPRENLLVTVENIMTLVQIRASGRVNTVSPHTTRTRIGWMLVLKK